MGEGHPARTQVLFFSSPSKFTVAFLTVERKENCIKSFYNVSSSPWLLDNVVTKAGDSCADEHTLRLVVKAKRASRKWTRPLFGAQILRCKQNS